MRSIISSEVVFSATMQYLDYRIYGLFFSFVAVMFRAFYVGITRTKILTVNALVMAVANIVFNYMFIFGKWGCPQMGIAVFSAYYHMVLFLYFYRTFGRKTFGYIEYRS